MSTNRTNLRISQSVALLLSSVLQNFEANPDCKEAELAAARLANLLFDAAQDEEDICIELVVEA